MPAPGLAVVGAAADELPRFEVLEVLPDGRRLICTLDGVNAGQLFVHGESNREPEAARLGYGTPSSPTRWPARRRHAGPRMQQLGTRAPEVDEAEARAEELFISLLDDEQRRQWRRWRSVWVPTPRGPVRLGVLHDLRFRPQRSPGEERSLCVVPTGPPLPVCDVWSNLLLVLSVDPDTFFRVASVRATGLQPSLPRPP